MRILIALGAARQGGTELQFLRLAEELTNKNQDVHLVLLGEGDIQKNQDVKCSVPTTSLNLQKSLNFLSHINGIIKLIRLLRTTKPEVVLAALPNTTTFVLAITSVFSRKSMRVAAIRGTSLQKNHLATIAYKQILMNADLVVCNSPHLKDEIVRGLGIPAFKVDVIPNGVDIPTRDVSFSWPPTRAITVANFLSYKGHADLIQAIALMDNHIEFVLCGNGELQKSLMELGESLGVSERLIFLNDANVTEECHAADFMVHPSTMEGLSNAILEGLANGLPVVACDIPGNATLIDNGVNGILAEVESPQSLNEATSVLISRRSVFLAQSFAAKETAKSFSWEKSVRSYIDVFNKLRKT